MNSQKTSKERPEAVKPDEVIEPKPSTSSRLPRLTIAVIIFILLVASYFILSSRNNLQGSKSQLSQLETPAISVTPIPFYEIKESDGLKTLIDKKYSYSFAFPSDWGIKSGNNGLQGLSPDSVTLIKPDNFAITIAAEKILNNDDSNGLIKEWSINNKLAYGQDPIFKDLTIGGSSGRQAEFIQPGPEGTETKIIYTEILKGENVYYFYTIVRIDPSTKQPIGTGQEEINFYNQILSTFQFLDQDQSQEGQFCGGIRGIICPTGFKCKYDGDYPDAGGICVEE